MVLGGHVFRRSSITDPHDRASCSGRFLQQLLSQAIVRRPHSSGSGLQFVCCPFPSCLSRGVLRRVLPKALCIFLGLLNVIVVSSVSCRTMSGSGRSRTACKALDTHYPPLPGGQAGRGFQLSPDIYFMSSSTAMLARTNWTRVYDFDNREFLNALRERGFKVSGHVPTALISVRHILSPRHLISTIYRS